MPLNITHPTRSVAFKMFFRSIRLLLVITNKPCLFKLTYLTIALYNNFEFRKRLNILPFE